MTRPTLLLLTLCFLSAAMGAAAPALAARGKGTTGKPDTNKDTAADAPDATAAAKKLAELCANKDQPLKSVTAPLDPTNLAEVGLTDGKAMTDDDEKKLTFDDAHCKFSRSSTDPKVKSGCDSTYARSYRGVRDGNIALKDALGKVCDKVKQVPTTCSDQTTFQKCSGDIYKGVATDLTAATSFLDGIVKSLAEMQTWHLAQAKTDQAKTLTADATIPTKFIAKASKPDPATRNTDSMITGCEKTVRLTPFCEHVAAASDSAYFAGQLKVVVKEKADLAGSFDKAGAAALKNAGNGGNTDNSGKSGITGGMGLDDMIKMATLGLTGAGLYCTISKSCSSQSDPSASTATDPNANAATSPTPSSPNTSEPSKPETSQIGSSSTGTGGTTGSSSTGSMPQTSAATGSVHSGGGFSGMSDPSLQHFNGSLDQNRSPASSAGGAVGGGGGGGGTGGGTLVSPSPDGAPVAKSGDNSGSGSLPGGGGFASAGSGGFNLDSKSSSPTDSALKNILNGDGPTSTDASLNPLGDQAGAAGNAEENDPENLFVRVRDTHVRCQKRGCVGREVGNNI